MSEQRPKRVAVLGAGRMGETLIRGLLKAGTLSQKQIVATAAHDPRLALLRDSLGISTTLDNREAVASADCVLLCVKPQVGRVVVDEIRDVVRKGTVVISVLASLRTDAIERWLGSDDVAVVRAMPNTPSLVAAGMTALCGGRFADGGALAMARRLFDPLGRTIILDEKHFDAVTGLSASGPAFVYLVIEALADGGVKVGLPRSVAIELAAQTCFGAARMVLETGSHPALLKDEVTTPAGCTVDGLLQLEEGGLRVTLIKAVVEATRRAGELVREE